MRWAEVTTIDGRPPLVSSMPAILPAVTNGNRASMFSATRRPVSAMMVPLGKVSLAKAASAWETVSAIEFFLS
ncbi:MAG: hypothetical protein ACKVQR_10465 [Aquabacterium sp.]